MNQVLREYVRDIQKKHGRSLQATVKGVNTVAFVDRLKDDLSNDEIVDFFKELVKHVQRQSCVLPQKGYLNLVKFAAREGLLEK